MRPEEPRFEQRDVASLAIAATGLLAILSIWVLLDATGTFFRLLRRETRSSTGVETSILEKRGPLPGPRLQEFPEADLDAYLKRENKLLDSYGWVDRRAGIARIPISRAMEMLSHEHR